MEEIIDSDEDKLSGTDYFLKMIGDKIFSGEINVMKGQKPVSQVAVEQLNNPNPSMNKTSATLYQNMTDEEVIEGIPDYIKTSIEDGHLNLEQVKDGLEDEAVKRGILVTEKDKVRIESIFKTIKDKVKKKK